MGKRPYRDESGPTVMSNRPYRDGSGPTVTGNALAVMERAVVAVAVIGNPPAMTAKAGRRGAGVPDIRRLKVTAALPRTCGPLPDGTQDGTIYGL